MSCESSVSKETACHFAGTFVNLIRVPQQTGSTFAVMCQAACTDPVQGLLFKIEVDACQVQVQVGMGVRCGRHKMVCYCTALTCIDGLHGLALHSPCRYHCEGHLASQCLMCDRLSEEETQMHIRTNMHDVCA